MITLTEAAAQQVREAAGQSKTEGLALRFAVETKPDGTFHYLMGFDAPGETDIRAETAGVDVIFAPDQAGKLNGMKVDYVEIQGTWNFIFINPNEPGFAPPDENATQHDLGGG